MFLVRRRLFLISCSAQFKGLINNVLRTTVKEEYFVVRGYSAKKGNNGLPVSTLFVPVMVKSNPDDINVGAELTGSLNKGELLKILNRFFQKREIKVLAMENGIDRKNAVYFTNLCPIACRDRLLVIL